MLHNLWGDFCDDWHLLKQEELSIIHERMPPETSEVRHYHQKERQFFFVLSGTAAIEIDGEVIILHDHEGVEVPPNALHQMMNKWIVYWSFL
jgi:mannose-6-phosphate isomerase-like protein (cupin superfamily)